MRRKWKIGLVLTSVAAAFAAYWWWPSQEPAYEGKRLGKWLDEGLRLSSSPLSPSAPSPRPLSPSPSRATNQSLAHVIKAVQAIGARAIPFLLRDMERTEFRWLGSVKNQAYKLKLLDRTHLWNWRLNRSVWGFQALGTNGAPALERLLALHDGEGLASGSAGSALIALGPFAVAELEKRLHATNFVTRRRAAGTLAYFGPTAESVTPSLLRTLDDTNAAVRSIAFAALTAINSRPERSVPLLRKILSNSNDQVRASAAAELGRVGLSARAGIPDLIQATNDLNPAVVESARRALQRIESAIVKDALR